MTQIPKQDAPLYIDVTCYKCKRCVALSNAIERGGRYYCERCLHLITGNSWPISFASLPKRRVRMKHIIARLAYLRHNIAEQENMLAGAEAALQSTAQWAEVERRRKRLQARKVEEKEAGVEVRKAAMAIFAETDNRTPHPAIKIKDYTVLDYDDGDAFAYAREHLPHGVQLVRRSFERAAKVLELDFVTIWQEPRATIARDLSEYLSQE